MIYAHTNMYISIHTHIHVCVYVYMYMYTYKHTQYISIDTYIYVYILSIHTYIHTYIHTSMHAYIHTRLSVLSRGASHPRPEDPRTRSASLDRVGWGDGAGTPATSKLRARQEKKRQTACGWLSGLRCSPLSFCIRPVRCCASGTCDCVCVRARARAGVKVCMDVWMYVRTFWCLWIVVCMHA